MTNVSNAEKKAMADLMSGLSADPFGLSTTMPVMESEPGKAVAIRTPVLDESGQMMRDVLKNLYSCADFNVHQAIDTASTFPKETEAYVTERTERGARVGSWEIVKHGAGDFDVVHLSTGEPIAKGLKIYEAAYALVSGLNAGKTITDAPIRKILALEEQYAQHLGKASHFKHMAKKLTETGETTRAAIAEDRFDDARDKAVSERNELLRLSGLL